MKVSRVLALMRRELALGPRNAMFHFAVIIPLAISLIVQLFLGDLLSGSSRFGVVSDDRVFSLLVDSADFAGIRIERYAASDALRDAVAAGSVDLGVVLPADLPESLRAAEPIALTSYIWGESQLRHRATIGTGLTAWMRTLAGQDVPIDLTTVPVGEAQSWQQRLLPLIVLMCIGFGAVIFPASSLVMEQMRQTMTALELTPLTTGEILFVKGFAGVLLSLIMALMILIINAAGAGILAPAGLILLIGSIFAAQLGVLLGITVNNLEALFAAVKSLALVLYGPALVALFPQVPEWVGYLFPTFYIVNPVIQLTQHGAAFVEILPQLAVLIAEILIMFPIIAYVARQRTRLRAQAA